VKTYRVIVDEHLANSSRRLAAATSPCWRTALELVEEAMDERENPWNGESDEEPPKQTDGLLS
jgi:hypothetical protein